MLEMRSEE